MSLSSAKAKLDAQGGDPVTGYISKTDHQESYDELVDDTALTGATTAEAVTVSGALVAGTVNGRDPDDLVTGPASATDNALARFDGTGGKTVQNSGITVDDSGNVTSDLTMLKATPTLTVSASSGTSTISISRPAASAAALIFKTGIAPRWQFGANSAAESGSNAGSNFVFSAFTDAGGYLSDPLVINRATGKATLGSVGATAGLELGSLGPRVMSGTGSPEGVVTAPVGSQWTDTAATTGAIRWIKASGTGNTGWVVEYGDTGLRNVSALIPAAHLALNPNAAMTLRRIGSTVTITYASGSSPTATALQSLTDSTTLPAGFRYTKSASGRTPTGITLYSSSGAGSPLSLYMSGSATLTSGTHVSGTGVQGSISFTTDDAWPSSLPGSAA